MNILILANDDLGLYLFRKELIEELLLNHKVIVSSPFGNKISDLKALGCSYIETSIDRRSVNPLKDIKLFLQYIHLIKRFRPNLVISYTIKPNIYGGFACRLLQVPYATNITGLGTALQRKGLLYSLVKSMYKIALKRSGTVFFENTGNMQIMLQEKIITNKQCRLLAGAGVNLEHFYFAPYPDDAAPVRFLFVGRIMKEKGIDELFSAMRRLILEGIPCVLDAIGYYEEDYSQVIQTAKMEGWLNYEGYQSDVRPFIKHAHCFVLPSWHEGMANTNLECAAMGRPLITSRIHGCMEAVIEGESGFLCDAKNADSLYSAMREFIDLPYPQKASMGAAGRTHMENSFDKKQVVADTIEALEVLMQ